MVYLPTFTPPTLPSSVGKYIPAPLSVWIVTNHFKYQKWRNPHLYKLYGYGVCKGSFPIPQNSRKFQVLGTMFGYFASRRVFPVKLSSLTNGLGLSWFHRVTGRWGPINSQLFPYHKGGQFIATSAEVTQKVV